MSREHKAKKRKKREHQYGGERIAVKDGTRYYDAEGYIPQYWPNPNSCPTENVVTQVQASGVVMQHTTNNTNVNVCLAGEKFDNI